MDDRQLYETVLGLAEPWYVSGVDIRADRDEIWVYVDVDSEARHVCPECGEPRPSYDRAEERSWRHLDTCQYRTIIKACVPRVECPEHGVRRIRVPWAERMSRFTNLFEAFAICLLGETTVLGVARLLKLSWHEAEGIQRRAVKRGLARRGQEPIRALGIDEKSFQKRHEYVTLAVDLEGKRVCPACGRQVGRGSSPQGDPGLLLHRRAVGASTEQDLTPLRQHFLCAPGAGEDSRGGRSRADERATLPQGPRSSSSRLERVFLYVRNKI